MSEEDTITISLAEYNELVADAKFLSCLIASGVDNWDYYDEARNMMEEDE